MEANNKSETQRSLLPLWDYGWVDEATISLPPAKDFKMLVRSYLASESFGTSFVGPQEDVSPDIHGPFLRTKISVAHYFPLSPSEFIDEIQLIRQPPGFREQASDDQWEPVQKVATELAKRHMWVSKLMPNEENIELHHEFGWILTIFREYLFANPDSSVLSRLVFGMD